MDHNGFKLTRVIVVLVGALVAAWHFGWTSRVANTLCNMDITAFYCGQIQRVIN